MTNKTLNALWFAVGTFLMLYTVNALLANRGAGFQLPGVSFSDPDKSIIYGLFAFPIIFFMIWIAKLYAIKNNNNNVTGRIPSIPGVDINGSELQPIKWFLFTGFLIIPVFSQLHFILQMIEKPIYITHQKVEAVNGGFSSYFQYFDLCHDCYRFASPYGVTYFPFWELWLFTIIVITMWIVFLKYLFQHLVRKNV